MMLIFMLLCSEERKKENKDCSSFINFMIIFVKRLSMKDELNSYLKEQDFCSSPLNFGRLFKRIIISIKE